MDVRVFFVDIWIRLNVIKHFVYNIVLCEVVLHVRKILKNVSVFIDDFQFQDYNCLRKRHVIKNITTKILCIGSRRRSADIFGAIKILTGVCS